MAEYVLVENGSVVETHDFLPKSWRNVSGLNLLANEVPALIALGWYPVVKQTVSYNSDTQRVVRHDYVINQDSVTEIPVVEDKPPEETHSDELKKEFFMLDLRRQRNQLLADSDWTQLPDCVLSEEKKEQYRFYRQLLRDLPNQYIGASFQNLTLMNITWPDLPL